MNSFTSREFGGTTVTGVSSLLLPQKISLNPTSGGKYRLQNGVVLWTTSVYFKSNLPANRELGPRVLGLSLRVCLRWWKFVWVGVLYGVCIGVGVCVFFCFWGCLCAVFLRGCVSFGVYVYGSSWGYICMSGCV